MEVVSKDMFVKSTVFQQFMSVEIYGVGATVRKVGANMITPPLFVGLSPVLRHRCVQCMTLSEIGVAHSLCIGVKAGIMVQSVLGVKYVLVVQCVLGCTRTLTVMYHCPTDYTVL